MTLKINKRQINASKSILDKKINNDIYNLTVPYVGTFLNNTAIKSLIATGLIDGFENQSLITNILKYYRNDYDFIIDQSQGDEKINVSKIRIRFRKF